ncbi:hypothetical protein FDH34_gp463 [Serratia phage BF]|uniref:Uncharacterized protein n=2 Tax=Eneladusvirus BF TaxID=2560751 RepID=A0A7L8ZLR4_9CAUD|nr:hypothetical protein FDH34_gp463 [Serratia phage BF]AQW88982.1 hypothetical protein BF_0457 [Serratia phage BF]QOI71395.1 hypothetical protein pEaSNUABM12_00477 [Erwinia phage pEa_SNUABM_12]QXO11604.1 hypothetical protein pEaSNUABM19_00478 [Erwinia phage pEa_SNUABM_19]QXO12152.1 hypothetical protein pEaSNUABM44_00476 [Erwinia phage pEa_SNUABM_44]
MKRNYFHFVTFTKPKVSTTKSADDVAQLIEDTINKMQEDGEKYGEIHIDMPEDLTPEEQQMFIEEIMKRFGGTDE